MRRVHGPPPRPQPAPVGRHDICAPPIPPCPMSSAAPLRERDRLQRRNGHLQRETDRLTTVVNNHSEFPHLRLSKMPPPPWLKTMMRRVPVVAVGRPSAACPSRCGRVCASTATAASTGLLRGLLEQGLTLSHRVQAQPLQVLVEPRHLRRRHCAPPRPHAVS